MNNLKRLAPGAYLIALLLLLIPMWDNLTSLLPVHASSSAWRFGFFGLISNALLLPSIGALIAFAAAIVADHARTLRALRLTSWVIAILMLMGVVLFAFDAAQTKNNIQPQIRRSFKIASVTAGLKLLTGAATLALLGLAGRREEEVAPSVARRP